MGGLGRCTKVQLRRHHEDFVLGCRRGIDAFQTAAALPVDTTTIVQQRQSFGPVDTITLGVPKTCQFSLHQLENLATNKVACVNSVVAPCLPEKRRREYSTTLGARTGHRPLPLDAEVTSNPS